MSSDILPEDLSNPPKPAPQKRKYTIPFYGWIETESGMKFRISSHISTEAYSYTEATKKIREQLPSLVALSLSSGTKLIKFNLN